MTRLRAKTSLVTEILVIKAAIAFEFPGSILHKLSATIKRVFLSLVAERISIKAAIAFGFPLAILPNLSATLTVTYLSSLFFSK